MNFIVKSNYQKEEIQKGKFIDVDLNVQQIKVLIDEQFDCDVGIISTSDDKLIILVGQAKPIRKPIGFEDFDVGYDFIIGKGDKNGTQSNN